MMVERRDIVSPGEGDKRSVDIGNPANHLCVDTTLKLPDRYAADDRGMYRVVKDALETVLCIHGRGGIRKGVSILISNGLVTVYSSRSPADGESVEHGHNRYLIRGL